MTHDIGVWVIVAASVVNVIAVVVLVMLVKGVHNGKADTKAKRKSAEG